ncbi:MAG: class I SAM-dependent methyltransferase [Candidatus Binataceae bacterium]
MSDEQTGVVGKRVKKGQALSATNPLAQKAYWEEAGAKGYDRQMFASAAVERHINRRLWHVAVEIGLQLGMDPQSHVLDLGCGDGSFANTVLARCFRAVDGFDFAEAAIRHAQANAIKPDIRFNACDITQLDYSQLPHYDGAFLIGILHHVKHATPAIIRSLRAVTSRVVVLEPNGDNIIRKLLELTPSYRAAGEDSFRTSEVVGLFEDAGFQNRTWRRLNLFPNFTPRLVFELLRPIEPLVEATPGLRALCTVNMYGFTFDVTEETVSAPSLK